MLSAIVIALGFHSKSRGTEIFDYLNLYCSKLNREKIIAIVDRQLKGVRCKRINGATTVVFGDGPNFAKAQRRQFF